MTSFAVGSLVRARGREWVVLPESEPDLLVLRPLGGTEDEITGIYVGKTADGMPFEAVQSASFPLPDPTADLSNHLSGSLRRDAVRLGFRSAAGPFRSLARIAVEPRPYQFVPLLMALQLDTVRLLIADDVGIGKTVEACLIARELHDRGEIRRLAVLCPPHLAEQWQRALREQFHLDAALVLSGTVIQRSIDEELAQELAEVERAIGGADDVERFTLPALKSLRAVVSAHPPWELDVRACRAAVRDAIGEEKGLRATFHGDAPEGTRLLTRTHPIVEGLAAHVLETALDPSLEAIARRAGVLCTRAVQQPTTLLLVRLRFHLLSRDRQGHEHRLLAEDLALAAFSGSPENAVWLPSEDAAPLLAAEPNANVPPDAARAQIERILEGFDALRPRLAEIAKERGKALVAAHRRVRKVERGGERTTGIEAHDAVDVLGIFVYLPVDSAGTS